MGSVSQLVPVIQRDLQRIGTRPDQRLDEQLRTARYTRAHSKVRPLPLEERQERRPPRPQLPDIERSCSANQETSPSERQGARSSEVATTSSQRPSPPEHLARSRGPDSSD